MYRDVDIETWPRRTAFEYFRDYDDPFFNIAANLDVTQLYAYVKDSRLSYALAALFYSQESANEIREFKIRLLNDRPVECDSVHATQTILNPDESFSFCYFENRTDVFEYVRYGREATAIYKERKTFDVESGRLDLIYYSVIPWISFTSFKHASRIDNRQTVPRIVFGKIFDSGPLKLMPVSVEVNHAIMDGLHVGKYFASFQDKIRSL
ncbi:MAG: CatA-like O-acetyltransferase [Pyrinomonadaceae bacterium]